MFYATGHPHCSWCKRPVFLRNRLGATEWLCSGPGRCEKGWDINAIPNRVAAMHSQFEGYLFRTGKQKNIPEVFRLPHILHLLAELLPLRVADPDPFRRTLEVSTIFPNLMWEDFKRTRAYRRTSARVDLSFKEREWDAWTNPSPVSWALSEQERHRLEALLIIGTEALVIIMLRSATQGEDRLMIK